MYWNFLLEHGLEIFDLMEVGGAKIFSFNQRRVWLQFTVISVLDLRKY